MRRIEAFRWWAVCEKEATAETDCAQGPQKGGPCFTPEKKPALLEGVSGAALPDSADGERRRLHNRTICMKEEQNEGLSLLHMQNVRQISPIYTWVNIILRRAQRWKTLWIMWKTLKNRPFFAGLDGKNLLYRPLYNELCEPGCPNRQKRSLAKRSLFSSESLTKITEKIFSNRRKKVL
ncbi:MAG: hypothetical protein IJL15_00175 [Clostridia bacterium]|nr:hypothetical protein [Clostridia bacterium]